MYEGCADPRGGGWERLGRAGCWRVARVLVLVLVLVFQQQGRWLRECRVGVRLC